MIKRLLPSLSFATVLAVGAIAAPMQFDFKDPKGVNAIQFHLDSLLEPIAGSASGITGTVSYDPAAPAGTTGKIVVAAPSLIVPNDTMTEHLHSAGWIDAAKYPEITFEITGLTNVKTEGNTTSATAAGKFTLKGVTKDISVPVKLTYLPDALEKRTRPGNKGDLLVVRGDFSIDRGDYGIKPGENEDKVSPTVDLSIAIVGSAPKA